MSSRDTQKKSHHHHEVFSVERAGHLDTGLRRFLYRPERLAERFVKPGYRVLDFGCGPGFFTREFAKRIGENGQVFSVDLQVEMLNILRGKMEAEGLLSRITTHQCKPDSISLPSEMNGTFDGAPPQAGRHTLLYRAPVHRVRPGVPGEPCARGDGGVRSG